MEQKQFTKVNVQEDVNKPQVTDSFITKSDYYNLNYRCLQITEIVIALFCHPEKKMRTSLQIFNLWYRNEKVISKVIYNLYKLISEINCNPPPPKKINITSSCKPNLMFTLLPPFLQNGQWPHYLEAASDIGRHYFHDLQLQVDFLILTLGSWTVTPRGPECSNNFTGFFAQVFQGFIFNCSLFHPKFPVKGGKLEKGKIQKTIIMWEHVIYIKHVCPLWATIVLLWTF